VSYQSNLKQNYTTIPKSLSSNNPQNNHKHTTHIYPQAIALLFLLCTRRSTHKQTVAVKSIAHIISFISYLQIIPS
jgi:hypothetical protein